MREAFPHLPCNAGGADVRASICEEKVTVALNRSVLVLLLLCSKNFTQVFPVQKHCHHSCDFQSGVIIVLLVAHLNKKNPATYL